MQDTLLNLIPGACSPEVHLSQYDKGRVVPFKLADGKSAYDVPAGSAIVVKATKPSGLGFIVPVSFEGDTATMTITETMSNEYGRFPAELSITNGDTLIGTANFVLNVEKSPHPEGTIDGDAESLLPELTLLVERIEAAADSVDEDTQTVTEAKAEVLQAKADTLQAKADTLSARDDALQAKADAITAKESAEASAQAAAEASERAEELIGSVATKADAIVKTASGEIASFSDGGDDLPIKSLKVNIVPKQSGTGDPSPSNVRPISGWDSVAVNVSGADTSDYETITTNLPQTVYGGVLDVVSGKLTVDKGYVDLGTLSWSKYTSASTNTYRARINGMDATITERNSGLISSTYSLFYGLQLTALDNNTMLRFGGEAFIRDDRYSDATAFKNGVNGVQLVYELETPTEIQLTPTEVNTLLGQNNIWSESGTVEVEYRADTTLAYNELVAMILENIGG